MPMGFERRIREVTERSAQMSSARVLDTVRSLRSRLLREVCATLQVEKTFDSCRVSRAELTEGV